MTAAAHTSVIRGTGTSTPFTNEPCTDLGIQVRYQIDTDAKRLLDPAVAVVVEVDDGGGFVAADADDYDINFLFGIITFDPPLGSGDDVRVSGNYLPTTDTAAITDWNYTCSRSVLDKTAISDGADRVKLLGLRDISGSITINEFIDPALEFDVDLFTKLTSDVPTLFEREVDGKRFRAWILLESEEFTGGIDELIGETLNFTGAAQADGGALYAWEP